MTDKVGQWCLYQWWTEHGDALIHPSDLAAFRELGPSGRVFQVVEDDGFYLTLSHGNDHFRVRPDLFRPVPRPFKVYGDTVQFIRSGVMMMGTVTEIVWHYKKLEPYYFLHVGNKRLKKRYWQQDFLE